MSRPKSRVAEGQRAEAGDDDAGVPVAHGRAGGDLVLDTPHEAGHRRVAGREVGQRAVQRGAREYRDELLLVRTSVMRAMVAAMAFCDWAIAARMRSCLLPK